MLQKVADVGGGREREQQAQAVSLSNESAAVRPSARVLGARGYTSVYASS